MTHFELVDVRTRVPMIDAVEAMRWAFEAVSTGVANMPTRIHMHPENTNNTHIFMPAYIPQSPCGLYPASMTCKAVSVVPSNRGSAIPVTNGIVMVLSPVTGVVLALLDGTGLTTLRTGAAAGFASRLLSRPDAKTLLVIGAGGQAFYQVAAILAVRPITRILLASRTRERADTLALKVVLELGFSGLLNVVDMANVDTAVAEADIICTVTTSAVPVFSRDAVQPGTHINASGAYLPHMFEVPLETIASARFYVDRLSSALHESGEVVQGIERGVFTASHILGELGAVSLGLVDGRRSAQDVTIFKSAGLAAQDAVVAGIALA